MLGVFQALFGMLMDIRDSAGKKKKDKAKKFTMRKKDYGGS